MFDPMLTYRLMDELDAELAKVRRSRGLHGIRLSPIAFGAAIAALEREVAIAFTEIGDTFQKSIGSSLRDFNQAVSLLGPSVAELVKVFETLGLDVREPEERVLDRFLWLPGFAFGAVARLVYRLPDSAVEFLDNHLP